jgi:hypothetical protein
MSITELKGGKPYNTPRKKIIVNIDANRSSLLRFSPDLTFDLTYDQKVLQFMVNRWRMERRANR